MKKFLALAAATLLFTSLSFGQLGLHDIGGGVGYVSVSFTNAGSSSQSLGGFLIAAHANLGDLAKDLNLVPDIQYFSTSTTVNGGTWKVGDFAINANVHYNFEMEGMIKPYVGAGLGLDFFSTTASVTIPGYSTGFFTVPSQTYSATGSATRLGINLLVGANYKLNDKMSLLLEPRYVIASDLDNFQIKAGVTWALN
ncbi:MAG TPA: outer membrane beta-barrel protein [Bacteroidota bacterium]|nr:outer membrane beta-barrel protein [Bacteroidota bacterium]